MNKFTGAIGILLFMGTAANAGEHYDATTMWGTAPASNASESAAMHVTEGVVAGQVNAAKAGMLMSTGSETTLNISSIGSQNLTNTTVNGNGNNVNVSSDQTTSNTGNVTNEGTIGD